MRTIRVTVMFRKLLGLALAAAGIGIVASSMPGFVWIFMLGAALIWAGWAIFRQEHIC